MPATPPPSPDTTSRPYGTAAADAWLNALAETHDLVLAFDARGHTTFAWDRRGWTIAPRPATRADWLRDVPLPLRRAFDAEATPNATVALAGQPFRLKQLHIAPAGTAEPLDVVLLDRIADEGGTPLPAAARETPSELERRIRELETSLRGAAHDLRSPLVSVLGFTRLLRDEFGDPIGRTGRHFLDRIEQAGKNMQRLLHDLLELSRIEDTPNAPVHVNAITVLEQVAADLKVPLDERGVELVFPAEAPILVCDRTRLYQLFSNLIGNAIGHAAGEDGGRIEVEIEASAAGWTIRVQDDGPGIAAEDRDRIFQAFETARGAPSRGGKRSSGLGLAIVRKIVEAHGGHVHVESAPGDGACFVVFLPRPGDAHQAATD